MKSQKKNEKVKMGEKKANISTKRKVLTVFVILVLLAITAVMATNQETREKIINTIAGKAQNAEAEVYEDGSAELTDDTAIVSSASVVNRITGTEGFDADDEPGNDSSADNEVVRSFDKVTWIVEANMEINNTDHGSEDAHKYNKFRGGTICIEAKLPEEYKDQMKWSLEDMTWAKETGVLSEDGLTLTAEYKMNTEQITVPGKQELPLVLYVHGAGNGSIIDPEFKVWMKGNESNKENEGYEAVEFKDGGEKVRVSAKPGFNIKLVQNTNCQVKTNVDFNDENGDVKGRMYGYAIILQLYNQDENKGLKGLEYPKGDITFDIETKLEAEETINGEKVTTDITDIATPKLWNYKINIGSESENPTYGNISDRNMNLGAQMTGYSSHIAPYGIERNTYIEGNIYNSGNILMEQNNNIIHTTINNYKFNGKFPKYNAGYDANKKVQYTENIGCFSAGYFQVFVPDNEETLKENRTYYLNIQDTNIKLETVSKQEVTSQVVTNDDSRRTQHYITKLGNYSHYTYTYDDNNLKIMNNKGEHTNDGKGRKSKGQNFQLKLLIYQEANNDIGTEIKSVNKLLKFDGSGVEPILYDDGQKAHFITDTLTWKVWYVTKKDGTNWKDETERNNSNIEDLNLYENLENIPEDYICVGMYFESQDGVMNKPVIWGPHYITVRMKIKNTAEIGKTYGIMQDDDYWNVTLDRTTQTALNPDAEYPKTVWSIHNQQYVQIQYDENGQIITGTHQGTYWGNTILVVGADSSISAKSINKDTQEEKISYDLGNNENIVTLKVEPKLEELDKENPANVKGATIRVKETLPKELTYVAGSANYGEPVERITNEDGTTTLIWEKYNCNVGEEIEPLTFQSEIDPDTVNETTLKITSVIEPDREKIGLTSLDLRTVETEIKVVNLTSHKLYKEVETPIIENNGEIKYKVTYQNKTENTTPDFQLLDILPYNGDGRNTAYNGTYVLKDVKVTQTNESGNINTDNLKLYTTTDINARKITPKDEGIGVDEIWNEKTIGQEINEAVTVLALKGEIEPNTIIEMEIALKTNNNRAGDKYANTVTAQTSRATEVINTAEVETRVITRQIKGNIWYDTNENGIKDNDESYANRIEVELKKADGSKATDTNGNEIPNILTDSNGEYVFSNLPQGEYKVEIHPEDKYKLTTANVGSNKEINSKFEENEKAEKESYLITSLNNIQSPEIIESNVNAGLVVKDAKIIVKYLEEDNTPDIDTDNKVLKEQKEITQYEKDGEQVNYKIGDNYEIQAEQIENYITLRNSQNTSGVLNAEETVVTYYYTYNKQNIEISKIWKDNNNQAGKRPTSIKVTLKDGNEVVGEQVISEQNKVSLQQNEANNQEITDPENTWTTAINDVPVYRENGEKITYTVDEEENEGTLDSYIKTIEGTTITNTFTQNTEKTQVEVTKIWNDENNKLGKRPENTILILKREITLESGEKEYQEVSRVTINGTDNKGENENEWKYTFSNIAKYDENNDEIKYIVEEEGSKFYQTKTEEVAPNVYEITNEFQIPEEKISIEVTKIWDDNNNKAGKRPLNVTLILSGNNQEYKTTLTENNKTEENIWKATIEDLPKYDENANEIEYILSEENLDNIFYTEENTTINQQTKTITNKFQVPDERISIEVNKKWEDNNNELQRRPESVTMFLTGNNQEYETTLTESNKNQSDESIWTGTIGNLPKYDVNGNEINYTLDERPIASEFYTKTGINQETKTVTNTFAIPTESIQVPVTKIWEDNNNSKGYRPENIVLQIKEKGTNEVIKEQTIQGNKTTNEGWSYIFEVPKYNEEGEIVEYEIGEKDLGNKFYPNEKAVVNQENRTITNVFTVPNETVEITVNKEWVDTTEQQERRPETIILQIKGENGQPVTEHEINVKEESSYTFSVPRYDEEGNEVEYTADEVVNSEFYTKQVGEMTEINENQKEVTIINRFTKPEDMVNVTVNKVWVDQGAQTSRRPRKLVIELKEKNGKKVDAYELSTMVESSHTFENLPKYDENGKEIEYTADEIMESEFYTKQIGETIETSENEKTITITNTFQVPDEKVSIKVNKVWVDNDTQAQRRPETITIKLNKENQEFKTYEMNTKTEDSYTFTDLPKYNENGEEIAYSVDEIMESKFYTKQVGDLVISGENEMTIAIANIFTKPDEKTKITVNKVWNDNEVQNTRRPQSIIIEVKDKARENKEDIVDQKEISQANKVEGKENQWSVTFDNLEKYNEDGQEIQYEVDEKEKNPDDLKFYTKEVTEVQDNQATIRNTFTKPDDTTEITAIKIWDDNNNEAQKRPTSIKLQLKDGENKVGEEEITSSNKVEGTEKTEIINKINEGKEESEKLDESKVEVWKHTFTNVPKYNDNGEEIVYTADEEVTGENAKFYEKSVYELEVTNTFKVPEDKISVKVSKTWEDNDIQAQRRPDSVMLVLKQKEEKTNTQQENGQEGTQEQENWTETRREEVVAANRDTWEYTFTDLPKYDSKGNEIEYKVEEQEKTAGDLHFYTSNVGNVENEIVNGETTGNKTVEITNTFTKPQDTTEITATKIWNDNNNEANKRPTSIKLQLKNGTDQVGEQEITSSNKVEETEKENIVNTANEKLQEINQGGANILDANQVEVWKATFANLQKYDDNGQEIQYTADETEVNNGDLQFYEKELTGTSVINTFTQNTEKTSLTVTKKWVDNETQSSRRPQSVVIQLKNGNEVVASQAISEMNNKVDNNTWQYTFTDLAKYDQYNNIINYTVDEVEKESGDLDFYTKSINGRTITNTFTKPQDTIEITVNKEWEDLQDIYGKRPDTVTIQVKNGNQVIDQETITEKDNWQARFTGLPKYNENGEEISYTVDEEELLGEAQIYYTKILGQVENGQATITNKMTKYPAMVIVKYVDKNTGEEIHDRVEKEGIIGESYDVTEDKREISGYTLVEEPQDKTGIYTEQAQEKIYYYAKNTKVTVKYLEKDATPDNISDNVVVASQEEITGYEGKEYTTTKKEVEGYTFIESTDNTSGQMPREESIVIYYYAKNTQVNVKYLEQDNTPGDNTDNKVLAQETIQGYEGKEYNTEEKQIANYTFIDSTDNTTGLMTKEPIEVIYYYAQNTSVTVKYLEQGTNKKIAEPTIINGYEGKEYKTEEKKIANYTFVESTDNTEGKMTKEPIEVIYYYAQNTTVRVQHIDKETGEILKETIHEGKVGDICKTRAEDIESYVLVESPKNPDVVMKKGEQIVKYYYAHISQGVLEKHIDTITGEILYSELHKGNEGDKYDIKSKQFEGYDLVEGKLPINASGEMTENLIEVKYYYIKKTTVKVEYREKGTEEKLAEDVVITGHEKDKYTTQSKEIKGYSLVETPENATGTMEISKNPDGSNNTETVVTYYYIKQAGTVTEKHIDINSGKVLAKETHEGKVGDSYEIKAKEFEGYDLVTDKLPTNAKGEMTEEEIEVIYYYQKRATVKVQYIDKGKGTLITEEKLEGHEGDSYETEEKEFDGYDLIEVPSNSKGKMEAEEIVVKYYYARKAEVEIRYVEKETEIELSEKETKQGHVGDKYETTAKNIPYYKLVGQTNNIEGTMTEEKITVTYYYEKQLFNLGVDKWISKVNINGLTQNAQSYSQRNELYKIDIHRNKIGNSSIKVTYTIRITNTGEIEGNVTRLTEIIPNGFSYHQEDNELSWKEESGILTTDSLKDEAIKPGEHKDIEIVLRWNGGENNLGEKYNTVILSTTTNPAGYQDTNKEDNSSKSKMLITIATGLDSNDRVIMIGALQILILLAVGLMFGRKKAEKKVNIKN